MTTGNVPPPAVPGQRRWSVRAKGVALFGWMAWAAVAGVGRGPTVLAADLATIERRIAAEPAYTEPERGYCLLVFGPRADLRCWLVLDGDVLHADRDCDGTLGEEGERFERVRLPNGFQVFKVDGIRGPGAGPAVADELTVLAGGETTYLSLFRDGKKRQTVSEDDDGRLRFATTAAAAPVIHFDGPLELRLWHGSDRVLRREAAGTVLKVAAGTPGIGPGTTAYLVHDAGNVPLGVQPVLELEFPRRDRAAEPIRERLSLPDRCCHILFLGRLQAPDGAAAGKARGRISMVDHAVAPIPAADFEIEVEAAER
ncbi:MAG: hypothetical protein ACKONH_08845 [Planctomycetia bacterium]